MIDLTTPFWSFVYNGLYFALFVVMSFATLWMLAMGITGLYYAFQDLWEWIIKRA